MDDILHKKKEAPRAIIAEYFRPRFFSPGTISLQQGARGR